MSPVDKGGAQTAEHKLSEGQLDMKCVTVGTVLDRWSGLVLLIKIWSSARVWSEMKITGTKHLT